MDLFLKYTNQNNMDWLRYKSVVLQPNFLDALAKNLKYFQFKDNVDDLIHYHLYMWWGKILPNRESDFYNDNIIESLLNLKLEANKYAPMFNAMTEEQQKKFITLSIEKEVYVDFLTLNLKKENKKIIENNISKLLVYYKDILSLRDLFYNNKDCVGKINSYIDNNRNKVILSIMYILEKRFEIKDSTITDVISLIVDDVVKNENTKYSDIKMTSGGYSIVIFVKDKVIKLGKERGTLRFANNAYIVKPILRKILKNNEDACLIEITQRVDYAYDITNEQLYELYKNIRKLGLIWTDVDKKNVGKLLNDNEIYWRFDMEPSNQILNLDRTKGDFILKKGELVVLDADFIFDESDKNIIYTDSYLAKQFEKKYQDEKRQQIDLNAENLDLSENNSMKR